MTVASTTSVNVKQAVPFFGVTNMETSLRFYVDGLGFKMKNHWIPDRAEDHPDGRIRWCWLQLGEAAIMLSGVPAAKVGPRKRLGQALRFLSCVKTRSPFIGEFKIARNSDAETSICGETVCGLCRLRSRRLSHGVWRAPPMRQRKAN